MDHIRNPIEWSWDQVRSTGRAAGAVGHAIRGAREYRHAHLAIRHIGMADLGHALARGFSDFGAFRTDVMFLCIFYPLAGLVLGYVTFGYNLLPLLFPLISGFALIGPVAAVGLYEMSRRREQGLPTNWATAFSVLGSPAFGAIAVLALLLTAIFLVWLGVAWGIYAMTLGQIETHPVGTVQFLRDVLTTPEGWWMIGIGIGVGFLFAVLVLMISVVSFPILLDRDVGLLTAMGTSIRAVTNNPKTMALWGLIVAASLVIGSLPLFVGLIIAIPVLGHATWHLYRRLVPRFGEH
jgi:uncharacterized membrane protein